MHVNVLSVSLHSDRDPEHIVCFCFCFHSVFLVWISTSTDTSLQQSGTFLIPEDLLLLFNDKKQNRKCILRHFWQQKWISVTSAGHWKDRLNQIEIWFCYLGYLLPLHVWITPCGQPALKKNTCLNIPLDPFIQMAARQLAASPTEVINHNLTICLPIQYRIYFSFLIILYYFPSGGRLGWRAEDSAARGCHGNAAPPAIRSPDVFEMVRVHPLQTAHHTASPLKYPWSYLILSSLAK